MSWVTLGEQPHLFGPVFSSVKGMAYYRAQGAQGDDMRCPAGSQCCKKDSGCTHCQGGPRWCQEVSSQFTASLGATLPPPRCPVCKGAVWWIGFMKCLQFQITNSREPSPLTPEAQGKGAPHSGNHQGFMNVLMTGESSPRSSTALREHQGQSHPGGPERLVRQLAQGQTRFQGLTP